MSSRGAAARHMPGTGSAHALHDASSADGREGVVVRIACRVRGGRGGRSVASPRPGHPTCPSSLGNTIQLILPVSSCCFCCLPSSLAKRCSCMHMEASPCRACRSISVEHLAVGSTITTTIHSWRLHMCAVQRTILYHCTVPAPF